MPKKKEILVNQNKIVNPLYLKNIRNRPELDVSLLGLASKKGVS